MLDEPSAGGSRLCSGCGCSFSPPQPDPRPDSSGSAAAQSPSETSAVCVSKCETCQAGSSGSSAPDDGAPHKQICLEPHTCHLCTKTFISSAHLALHLASHSKERKFKCGTCGKLFHQPSHLMAHKLIHSGDRPFKCPECGKTFGRSSHLKTHRRLHTGEKPFKCTYCDKSFTQKAGLLAHVRLHTGDRLYKCEQCGEGFGSLAVLLSHKTQEACGQVREAPPAPPSQPPKTPSSTEDLKCGVCCRTFVRSSYIRLHIHLKNGQRPYHCKVCNKTFVKLDTFVSHCDKHLRQKGDQSEVEYKVVKPPLFVPVSQPPCAQTLAAQHVNPEVATRSKAKSKSETEP